MKILLVGSFEHPMYAPAFESGFKALGNEVVTVKYDDYLYGSGTINALLTRVQNRIHIGYRLSAYNNDIIKKAEALKEADYTADSWKAMQLELQEAKDLLAKEKPTQAEVDEATTHLNAAVEALVKADTKVTVTLNKKTATVYKGKTTTLKATVTGADAPKVTFTSSNPKVAAVNKTTGKVTAKAKGSAVITAKCGDVKVTCKVTVKNPTLTLNKTSASVKVGKTTKITAKAAPSGKVTYKSGNKKIATVSSNGTIKGIKKGTAKITVTCNGVTKTVKVTVK